MDALHLLFIRLSRRFTFNCNFLTNLLPLPERDFKIDADLSNFPFPFNVIDPDPSKPTYQQDYMIEYLANLRKREQQNQNSQTDPPAIITSSPSPLEGDPYQALLDGEIATLDQCTTYSPIDTTSAANQRPTTTTTMATTKDTFSDFDWHPLSPPPEYHPITSAPTSTANSYYTAPATSEQHFTTIFSPSTSSVYPQPRIQSAHFRPSTAPPATFFAHDMLSPESGASLDEADLEDDDDVFTSQCPKPGSSASKVLKEDQFFNTPYQATPPSHFQDDQGTNRPLHHHRPVVRRYGSSSEYSRVSSASSDHDSGLPSTYQRKDKSRRHILPSPPVVAVLGSQARASSAGPAIAVTPERIGYFKRPVRSLPPLPVPLSAFRAQQPQQQSAFPFESPSQVFPVSNKARSSSAPHSMPQVGPSPSGSPIPSPSHQLYHHIPRLSNTASTPTGTAHTSASYFTPLLLDDQSSSYHSRPHSSNPIEVAAKPKKATCVSFSTPPHEFISHYAPSKYGHSRRKSTPFPETARCSSAFPTFSPSSATTSATHTPISFPEITPQVDHRSTPKSGIHTSGSTSRYDHIRARSCNSAPLGETSEASLMSHKSILTSKRSQIRRQLAVSQSPGPSPTATDSTESLIIEVVSPTLAVSSDAAAANYDAGRPQSVPPNVTETAAAAVPSTSSASALVPFFSTTALSTGSEPACAPDCQCQQCVQKLLRLNEALLAGRSPEAVQLTRTIDWLDYEHSSLAPVAIVRDQQMLDRVLAHLINYITDLDRETEVIRKPKHAFRYGYISGLCRHPRLANRLVIQLSLPHIFFVPIEVVPEDDLRRFHIEFTYSKNNRIRQIVVMYQNVIMERDQWWVKQVRRRRPNHPTYGCLLGPELETPKERARHAFVRWLCKKFAPVKVGYPGTWEVGLTVKKIIGTPIYHTRNRAGVNVRFGAVYIPLDALEKWDIYPQEMATFLKEAYWEVKRGEE